MKQAGLSVFNEIMWAILAAVFAAAVLLPLYEIIDATFLRVNVLLALLFIILFRFILFLEKIPYLSPLWMRLFVVLVLSFIFYRIFSEIQYFFELFDSHDINDFLRKDKAVLLSHDVVQQKFGYFKKEFVFFSTGNLILTVALGLRIVGSLWGKLKSREAEY
jgi:hypothetical protein